MVHKKHKCIIQLDDKSIKSKFRQHKYGILMLLLLWSLCLSSVLASKSRVTRWGYDVNSEFVQAVKGSTSGYIYTLEKLSGGDAVVSRINGTTELPIWAKRVTLLPSFKSLALNHNESKLYQCDF